MRTAWRNVSNNTHGHQGARGRANHRGRNPWERWQTNNRPAADSRMGLSGLSNQERRLANERIAADRRRHQARGDVTHVNRRARDLRIRIGRYFEDVLLEVFGITPWPGMFQNVINQLQI